MPTPNDIIDVTPEKTARKPRRARWIGLISIILFSFIIGGAAYFGYPYWQQQQRNLEQLTAQLNKLQANQQITATQNQAELSTQQQRIATISREFSQQSSQLESAQQSLQTREKALNQQLRQAQQMVANSGTHWMVAEAEYLLRIAQQHLNLTRDLATVRYLLQQADQRLRSTQNPDWEPVRSQIAYEIASLNSVQQPDTIGIGAQLQALSAQVATLRLPNNTQSQLTKSDTTTSTETKTNLLESLWSGFQGMVRIRQHDQPIQAMIPPAQQRYLYENLRQNIQLTGLAVLRLDNRLYQTSLQQLTESLKTHFDPKDHHTQSLQTSLKALTEIDLTPKLPAIKKSLRMLYQQQQLASLTQPTTP